MKKKLVSFLLCLLMIISMCAISFVTASSANVLVWPVPGHRYSISQGFHNGNAIDISDGTIYGADVVAAMGGIVTHTFKCSNNHHNEGDCRGFGTGVVINGDDGRVYQYAHMIGGSIPGDVYNGAYVSAGQKIGQVGNTGWSYGAHLHFGIAYGQYYYESGIDPAKETYVDSIITAPTTASISVSKNLFKVGEEIVLNMSSDAHVAYGIGLDDENGNRVQTYGNDAGASSYAITIDKPGNYSCYVTAYNSAGSIDSSRVYFTVYDQKPSYSVITTDSDIYQVGDTVTFKVSGENVLSYAIGIDNEAGERIETPSLAANETSYTRTFDKAGKYSCYVTSINDYGYTDSERVYFTVYYDLSDLNGEWTYSDTLPANVTSDKYDVQYRYTYETVVTSAPDESWVKGDLVKTEYVNSGDAYWSNVELPVSSTRELVDYIYYHYCGGSTGNNVNFAAIGNYNHYDSLSKDGVYEHSVATDYDDSNYKFYHLKWNDGSDACCASGVSCDGSFGSHGYRSCFWYKSSLYQDKAEVGYYNFSKKGEWTTKSDDTASSVIYRYKQKEASQLLIGDVNGDGRVNVQDATMVQKYCASLVTLNDNAMITADSNRNGKVNIQDATLIQKFVAGLVAEL